MKRLIPTLAIGLLLTLPLRLQADEAQAEETPPWYQFEVIVFERIDKGAGSTELWPSNPDTPSLLDAIPFDTRGKQTLKDYRPIPYRLLPKSEQWLGGIWTRFRNSRNYRPLYHVAWRQQVVDPELAQKLYVYLPPGNGEPAGPANPPLLEGTLKFGVKRYLHAEADLLLRRPVNADAQSASTGEGLFPAPAIEAYRLHEKTRMRSGELHYLDHPVLGVLMKAEKFELPEPPPPEPQVPAADQPPAAGTEASGESQAPAEQPAPQEEAPASQR